MRRECYGAVLVPEPAGGWADRAPEMRREPDQRHCCIAAIGQWPTTPGVHLRKVDLASLVFKQRALIREDVGDSASHRKRLHSLQAVLPRHSRSVS